MGWTPIHPAPPAHAVGILAAHASASYSPSRRCKPRQRLADLRSCRRAGRHRLGASKSTSCSAWQSLRVMLENYDLPSLRASAGCAVRYALRRLIATGSHPRGRREGGGLPRQESGVSGVAGKIDFHQIRRMPKASSFASLLRMGMSLASAWAASMRSNGSPCAAVSLPARSACAGSIGARV